MEFKIETIKKPAMLTFQDGSTTNGHFFASATKPDSKESERIIDLLNTERACIPFESANGEILLIFKDSIATIHLKQSDLAPIPSYIPPTPAKFLLSSGQKIEGCVFIDLPKSRARLSDYLNTCAPFFPVRAGDEDHLVNARFLKLVTPLPE